MNAKEFLAKKLQKKHSPEEIHEIVSHISESNLNGIDFLLDHSNVRTAHKFCDAVVCDAKGQFIPHDICPKRHSLLSRPIILFSVLIHRRLGIHPLVGKYGVASLVVFGGAWMASNPVHFLPHFIWDGIAYSIHGIGLAPLAETLMRKLERKAAE